MMLMLMMNLMVFLMDSQIALMLDLEMELMRDLLIVLMMAPKREKLKVEYLVSSMAFLTDDLMVPAMMLKMV